MLPLSQRGNFDFLYKTWLEFLENLLARFDLPYFELRNLPSTVQVKSESLVCSKDAGFS